MASERKGESVNIGGDGSVALTRAQGTLAELQLCFCYFCARTKMQGEAGGYQMCVPVS